MVNVSEVAEHCKEDDCWIIINGKVYNVSAFLSEHPGGPEIILDQAGKDATEDFEDTGHSPAARETLKKYYVGEAEGATPVRTMKAETSSSIIPSIIFLLIVILLGASLNTDKFLV
jgi:cytochrome b involved in lipid metabolism